MSNEKGPPDWPATAGNDLDETKDTASLPDGEAGQLHLFAAPIVARPVDAALDPPHNVAPTSREAARRIKRHAPTQRQRILGCIAEAGAPGRIAEETATILRLRIQSTTARINELRRLGLIVDSGRRRPTSSGRQAIVWVAVAAAGSEVAR